MADPKIILWDLETTHNIVATFQLKNNDYINPENILQERYIVCGSWKVLGEKAVHAVSTLDNPKLFERDPHNDKHVVETLHKVLSSADCLVAHNGDSFDLKFFEARCLIHGLAPLPPITTIDTLKVARNRLLFNANRLDYLGNVLGVGRKKPTTTGLWLEVLKANKSAIREMVSYNKQDVLLLERVFLKLRPYVQNHLNRELFGKTGCPRCGSHKIQARGFHRAISRVYQRWQCQACSGWFKTQKPEGTATKHRVL